VHDRPPNPQILPPHFGSPAAVKEASQGTRLGRLLHGPRLRAVTRKRSVLKPAPLLFALVLFISAGPALAQVDPWEFEVYPAQTLGRGMVELETLNSVVADGHQDGGEGTSAGDVPSARMYRTALELTYGLTDRVEAAAYLNLAHPNGGTLQYAGSKFRLRGSLFEQGELPVDLGWYAELEWHKTPQFDDQDLELELRPILSKDLGRFSLVLNPKVEKVLIGPDLKRSWEFGYVGGIYYRALRWLSPGVEFYGGIGPITNNEPLSEQQHYIFPVLRGELPGGVEYSVGPGFGLTRGSDHVLVKFNLELERFVGALFAPPPATASRASSMRAVQ